MNEIIKDAILDTIKDTASLLPFLFVTYIVMEWLERRTEERSVEMLSGMGRFGHLLGAGIGLIPQCGFSAGAASLYSGGVITTGTLIAVFLSTSDEMLPIFISSSVGGGVIAKILALKFAIAIVSGFAVDTAMRAFGIGNHSDKHIHDLCEREHCGCEDEEGGILRSAAIHTLKITIFIFLISLFLSLLVGFMGRDALMNAMEGSGVIGTAVAGLIGLIPNCAASVVITQMYLEGILSVGQMMAGLLVGAGVGILVLARTNVHHKENVAIIGLLLALGIAWGLVIDATGISF